MECEVELRSSVEQVSAGVHVVVLTISHCCTLLLSHCLRPQKMNENSRLHTSSNLRNTLLSEVGIGISANSILLLFHILKFFGGHRPKPTDLPIGLLALIHLLMLLVMAVTATDIFISWQGWDDITCKFLVYLYSF